MPVATLNFTRGMAPIAVQAYMMLRLGRDGYARIMRQTLANAIHLRKRLVDSGLRKVFGASRANSWC
jgi:glutamate decarboxylase